MTPTNKTAIPKGRKVEKKNRAILRNKIEDNFVNQLNSS